MSISMMIVFTLSVITLKKHIHANIIQKAYALDFLKSIAACVCAVAAGKGLYSLMGGTNFLIRMIIIGTVMCAVYFAAGLAAREMSAADALGLIKRKFSRK